jgi:hypothetical protein
MAKDWRKLDTEQTPAAKQSARSKKIVGVLAMLLAFASALVVLIYILWNPAHPPDQLPIFVTESDNPYLPVNAQARQDWQALQEVFKENWSNKRTDQDRSEIERNLSALQKHSSADRVVVYLSGYVRCDSDGTLYVLTGDATADIPASGLPLRTVLEALHDCPAKEKLLVLDVMRPLTDPRLGVLADDAAGRVHALVKDMLDQSPDDPLWVLCACAPGQVAWTSQELGQSAFGYFVKLGLSGEADGYGDGKAEGRVMVRELAAYLHDQVDRWTRQNRGARQTPILLGKGNDFELFRLEQNTPKEPPAAAPAEGETAASPQRVVETYPGWLLDQWKLRDQWEDDGTVRLAPRSFRQLEARLLRAEQHWRGGTDPEEVKKQLLRDVANCQKQVQDMQEAISKPQPRSLALAVALGRKHDDAVQKFVEEWLKNPTPPKTPVTPEALLGALRKQFKDQSDADFNFNLAWALFETAVHDPSLDSDRLRLLNGTLTQRDLQGKYVETFFLQRLVRLADTIKKDGGAFDPATVSTALQAVHEGERAMACASWQDPLGEPRVLSWVAPALDRAAQKRHDGEVLLFTYRYVPVEKARKLLGEAVQAYQSVAQEIARLQQVYKAYDQALVRLPGYAPYFLYRPNEVHEWENWKEATRLTAEMGRLLAQAPSAGQVLPENERGDRINKLAETEQALHYHLTMLNRPFSLEKDGLLAGWLKQAELPDATPASYHQLEAALRVPCLRAGTRKKVSDMQHKLAERLATADQRTEKKEWSQADQDQAERAENERAARRARFLVELFQMGSAPNVDALARAVAQAGQTVPGDKIWPALGQEVRKFWANLPSQVTGAPTGGLSGLARDRLCAVLYPLDAPATAELDPHLPLKQAEARDLWRWLCDRCQYEKRDWQGLRDDASEFYVDAAQEYRSVSGAAPPDVYLSFQLPDITEKPKLREGGRATHYPLELRLHKDSNGNPAAITSPTVVDDESWLEATLKPDGSMNKEAVRLDVMLALRPDAERNTTAPPLGLLIEADVNGWTFHHKIEADLPDARKSLHLLVGATKEPPTRSLPETIELRPKTAQPYYVFVKNPAPEPRKITVRINAAGQDIPPLTLDVPGDQVTQIQFKPPVGAKPGDATELKDGRITVGLFDPANPNLALDKKTLHAKILRPQEYINANPSFVPGDKNRLIVDVFPIAPIIGPPCRVKLVLSPEAIPGFIRFEDGTLEGQLEPGKSEHLTLSANNLQFQESVSDRVGTVYLTVDGYERALIFRVPFPSRGTPRLSWLVEKPDLRVPSSQVTAPDENYKLHLQVDNAPPNAKVEIAVDKNNTNDFAPEPSLRGGRDERVTFTPGADGALVFGSDVKDWVVPLDTRGFRGPRKVRLRMVEPGPEGNEKLLVEKMITIVVDDTKPVDVHFVSVDGTNVADRAGSKDPIPVVPQQAGYVKVEAEGDDPESGISQVYFFVGEPKDDRRPDGEKPVVGRHVPETKRWRALLPVKDFGETTISVEFINGVQRNKFETITLALHDREKEPKAGNTPPAKPAPGAIAGVVTGPGGTQPGATVILKDDKGKEKDQQKADANGRFIFGQLEPGTYTVSSAVGERKDSKQVPVSAGKTTDGIELKLRQ